MQNLSWKLTEAHFVGFALNLNEICLFLYFD